MVWQVTGNYKILGKIMQEVKVAKESQRHADSKARKSAAAGTSDATKLLHRKHWVSSDHVSNCNRCRAPFTFVRRKHHCRVCGLVFCNSCSPG